MPINSLAVPSPSLWVHQCNKHDMRNLCQHYFMIVSAPALTYILFQLIICGNSQYFFPTHCKLPLCTLSGKLQTFPMVVLSKTIGFLLNRTQQYTPVLLFRKIPTELLPENELLSSHYVAYTRVTVMCYPTRRTWFSLGAWWKLLEPLGRTTSVTIHCTDEGHCIVTETFDTNLNLLVIQLVREWKKSHMDIPNHTGLYKC